MSKIRFIGDVHGKISDYLNVIEGCDKSIQVGDFGAGFVPLPRNLPMNHQIIRGNHDSPEVIKNYPNWIPDGHYDEQHGIFYCGGAWSIDGHLRKEGISWWRDEELNISELYAIIEKAEKLQPKIIVTHDCPNSVVKNLFGLHAIPTRTGQALNEIFEVCKPEIHVFGHWHKDVRKKIKGTEFICLDELSYVDLEI